MKTHQIVFINNGEENAVTLSPLCCLSKFTGDLQTQASRCMSWDNDMLVRVNLYSVVNVTLPVWMAPEVWLQDYISWGYMWNRGVDPSWPEAWQRKLITLNSTLQVACVKLLKTKKFRSQFRESLCNQLKSWMDGEAGDWPRPFSDKQLAFLVDSRDVRKAKQLDYRAYYEKLSIRGVVTHQATYNPS